MTLTHTTNSFFGSQMNPVPFQDLADKVFDLAGIIQPKVKNFNTPDASLDMNAVKQDIVETGDNVLINAWKGVENYYSQLMTHNPNAKPGILDSQGLNNLVSATSNAINILVNTVSYRFTKNNSIDGIEALFGVEGKQNSLALCMAKTVLYGNASVKNEIKRIIEKRNEYDNILKETALYHGKTPKGRRALLLHYRLKAVENLNINKDNKTPWAPTTPRMYIEKELNDRAETSWLTKIWCVIKEKDPEQKHLSDSEILKFLKKETNSAYPKFKNLDDYIAMAVKEADKKVGGAFEPGSGSNFEFEYLQGYDIPGYKYFREAEDAEIIKQLNSQ